MEAIARAAGVTKPVVYDCFAGKDTLFNALLEREEGRILAEIGTAFGDTDLDDPEHALVDGYTAFLRAVAASPDVYRLVFLQEGGGNAAIARRIQRGREAQAEALANLSRPWLSRRDGVREGAQLDRLAGLLGQALVGLAEAGARSVLSAGWTPEEAGRMLGRIAARSAAEL